MTAIARKVASVPVRLASDTWYRIIDLVAPTNGSSRAELLRITGVAASLITRESLKDSPFVVMGAGPRVRVYCIYGQHAIEGTNVNEAALPESPSESDTWKGSLPCPADDLAWVQAHLAQLSSRITARDAADAAATESSEQGAASSATIDLESFLRP